MENKHGRKRPLDAPKRMIERREREKERERKIGRRRDLERDGDIRERGERDREVKGAQFKPNPSPNAFPKLCEWFSGRFLLKGRGKCTVPSILVKSPEQGNKAQRKVDYKNYYAITMSRNYYRKL